MSNQNHRNGSNNGTANGVHKDAALIAAEHDPAPGAGHDLLWDGLPPAAAKALEQPLDPSLVSHRKGRARRSSPDGERRVAIFAYVEGRVAIQQANHIFGFGGWGYEVVGDVVPWETDTVDSKTGEVRRVRSYAATVRVTVPGAPPRTDVGFHTVAEETPEGHETAYKGAVTDGLKRALRSFGDQFGNCLYGDGAGDDLAPSLRATLVRLGVLQGFDEAKTRAAVKAKTGKDLDELPAAVLTPLVEGAAKKLRQSNGAETRKAA